jgi:hypothetical protein
VVAQQIDAGIIRSVAELVVELAELSVTVAAEGVVPALVAGVVDVGGDVRGAFGSDQRAVVVGGRVVCRLHLFRHPCLQGRAGV